MNLSVLLFLLTYLCFTPFSFSFSTPYHKVTVDQTKAQSIIVSFSKRTSPEDFLTVTSDILFDYEYLNPDLSLYKFTCFNAADEDILIAQLFKLDPGMIVQGDQEVQFRATTPNDPFFSNQWYLQKIGADKAWDITRSGVNRRGDTIVIAVVDDGLHINHPDFQKNLWVNYADTPGNLIDDDGNGFIDDTYGWNFQSNNNDISDSTYYKAGHGSPVAGIIGADGNNGTGISGVMWNTKLMIVNVADTGDFPGVFESDVIKAYSYILHQKKLYLTSNGSQGAFVVATNSSFGIDGGKAFQSPLWCSFYDTLGKYGIVNVSSATNSNVNIDVSGDLPSQCQSEHLIVVSGSTAGDNHGGSGYSTTSVDLSAPGYNLFSTAAYTPINIQNNQVYKSGFSGTSFSAPMVSAAIGMLNAYACERVLDSIKSNPAKANLMFRLFLLAGVDETPGLAGKSVTGGRLNIYNSLRKMEDYCAGILSVQELEKQNSLWVYPNPGSGSELQLISAEEIKQVYCVSPDGKKWKLVLKENSVDVSALEQGVYVLILETASGNIHTLKYQHLN